MVYSVALRRSVGPLNKENRRLVHVRSVACNNDKPAHSAQH